MLIRTHQRYIQCDPDHRVYDWDSYEEIGHEINLKNTTGSN